MSRIGQFAVEPGFCGAEVHSPEDRGKWELCVEIRGTLVCANCTMEYHTDFDEAVEEWRLLNGQVD